MTISILIIDGQRLVRAGLGALLAQEDDFEVLAGFGEPERALAFARRHRPDVVVVEDRGPLASSLDVVRELGEQSPDSRCIVLTDAGSGVQAHQAIVAGACGLLSKQAAGPDLAEAVRTVGNGGSYLSPDATGQVVDAVRSRTKQESNAPSALTMRQQQVLRLIADGLSTKEIAVELGISEKTAQTHRAKLMGRTGIRKASGLVRYAIREGLVSP